MKREILKFHYEEIVFVLMILSSELKKYNEDDLMLFAEAIHRLDDLSKFDFLCRLNAINPNLNSNVIQKITELHKIISQLYSGQWYKKMASENLILKKSSILASQILENLQEDYIEPIEYADNKMNVDW